jgi:hypothetical protein
MSIKYRGSRVQSVRVRSPGGRIFPALDPNAHSISVIDQSDSAIPTSSDTS